MPSKVSKTTSSKTPAKSTTKPSTSKTNKVETNPVKATPTTDTAPPFAVVQQLDDVQQTIISLSAQLRSLTTQLKQVQKTYTKERKQLEKLHKKKKHGGGSGVKHQSGIAKPGYISAELCDFIGVSTGTEMARTEVIKYVNKYIKDHQLQDQNNKKVIVPDSKLQTLLQSSKNDEITYFNLQTYMKPHYADPKKQVSVVA
jgi:upstream activation factor subunit UAF30